MNKEEIRAVLGFSLSMGINKLPNLRDYWKRDNQLFTDSPNDEMLVSDGSVINQLANKWEPMK